MTVAVSQAPVISETSATVTPPVGGILFSVFLPLFSLGAVMGIAAAAGSASRVGVQLCPSAPDGEAASFGTASATYSLVAGPLSGVASLPG